MKIALIGEYSSLHNNLAKALKDKGHEVLLVNDGDSFKDYNRDIDIKGSGKNIFIKTISRIIKEIKLILIIKNFDVVQYINPSVFSRFGPAKTIFRILKKRNSKTFLLAAGDDYYYWEAYRGMKYRYSPHEISLRLDIKRNKSPWETGRFKQLSIFLSNFVDGVIPNAIFYQIAYLGHPRRIEMIYFPIELQHRSLAQFKFDDKEKMKILHGAQTGRIAVKGTDLIDQALEIILKKYPERIEYMRIQDLPFEQYKKKISEAHVVIDQVYGYEPGMNALICMQLGKLVMGGYEKELKELNKIDYEPLINITPNVDDIVSKIELIIQNPEMIKTFYTNARKYVEEFHSAELVAEKFLNAWNKTNV